MPEHNLANNSSDSQAAVPFALRVGNVIKNVLLLASVVLSFSLQAQQPTYHASAISYSTEGPFEDVKENLILAIEGQGAVISYTAHSSDMLNRTAIALEIKEKIYDQAEVILFCKAELSHKMLRADPHSLVLCPYPISIYTLSKEPSKVYISIRKPPKAPKEYQLVHQLLTEIILESID